MTNIPANWYPDPETQGQLRWWNGTEWTEHRSATPAPYTATVATPLKAPEGTQWNTIWIWILVILPLVSILALFSLPWNDLFSSGAAGGQSALKLFGSPAYILTSLSGWIVYGLSALIAYLDWRELKKRSVPRPFHFAWVFLSSAVYVIGRSVVARRRIGRGISPMWVEIARMIVTFVLVIYLMSVITSTIVGSVMRMKFLGL